jgi:general stress protein 26
MEKEKNFGKSKKEVEQEIIEYLDANFLCVLATSHDNIIKATPVGYRNEGLTLWISCDSKEGQKVKDVLENPNVAVSRFENYEKGTYGWTATVGISYRGTAEVITLKNNEALFMDHVEKKGTREGFKNYGIDNLIRDFGENYEEVLFNRMCAIKIQPEQIHFMNTAKQWMYFLHWSKND